MEPDNESSATKATVILVHGTFAEPRTGGPPQWYQPGSSFCQALDEELKKLGSPAKCWAHGSDKYFFWSGGNDWISRLRAARRLSDYLYELARAGWTSHVIAHSHGGNIVYEVANRWSVDGLPVEDWLFGRVALLGTPILELKSRARTRLWTARLLAAFVFSLGLLCVALWQSTFFWIPWLQYLLDAAQHALPTSPIQWLVVAPIALLSFYFYSTTDRLASQMRNYYRDRRITQGVKWLVLNSDRDEAYQFLSAVSTMANPLGKKVTSNEILTSNATAANFVDEVQYVHDRNSYRFQVIEALGIGPFGLVFVLGSLHILTYLSTLVEGPVWEQIFSVLLVGAKAFFWLSLGIVVGKIVENRRSIAVFFALPVRLILTTLRWIRYSVAGLVWNRMRDIAWGYMRALTMGLDRFPETDLPNIGKVPRGEQSAYVYEELDDVVVANALVRRKVSWEAHASLLHDAAAQKEDQVVHIGKALQYIASEPSLVHASYFSDARCIRRIAEWLAYGDQGGRSATAGTQANVLSSGSTLKR